MTQFEAGPELHPFSREADPGAFFQLPPTNHSSLPTQFPPPLKRSGWSALNRRWLLGLLALLVIVSSTLILGLFTLHWHPTPGISTPTAIVERPTVTPTPATGLHVPFVAPSSAILWILLLLSLLCLLAIGGAGLLLRRRRRLKRQYGQALLKSADEVFLGLLTERVPVASFDAEEEQKRHYCRQNLRIYQKALYSNPDDERAWLGLGRAFEGLGFYQNALEIFQYTINYWPSATAFARAGHAALQLKRYHEAISFYRKALASDPRVSLAYAGYIQALQRVGRADEAEQVQMRARALGYLDEEQE
jgi:tetratricopeptide (TPR) repeat protein